MKTSSAHYIDPENINGAIEYLNKKDTVNLAGIYKVTNSPERTVEIRSGGAFSRIRGLLSSKNERIEKANNACTKIDAVLSDRYKGKSLESVKKNIREQIMKTGCLTGKFLAINLEALQENRSLIRKPEIKP